MDAPAWTPALVQQYLADSYGVEYSQAGCRRLLKEAGHSYQKPLPSVAAAPDEREEVHDEPTKSEEGWMPQ